MGVRVSTMRQEPLTVNKKNKVDGGKGKNLEAGKRAHIFKSEFKAMY